MKKNNLLFILLALMCACNSSTKPKEEEPKLETYTNATIGWTISVPKGFQVLSKSRVEANEQKGRAAIGAIAKDTAKVEGLQHLINFQKNQFNLFSATIEPFKSNKVGDYEKNIQMVKKLVYDAYTSQHIKIDTSSGKEVFGKRSFNAFYIKIYGPNGFIIMNQHTYSTLINGYDFGININYNNEVDKKMLLDAFKNSSF